VVTIANLDKDLVSTMPLMQSVANYLQGHQIDLKLLTKALNSSKMISEADEPWTNLFADVKSAMQSEREVSVRCAQSAAASCSPLHGICLRDVSVDRTHPVARSASWGTLRHGCGPNLLMMGGVDMRTLCHQTAPPPSAACGCEGEPDVPPRTHAAPGLPGGTRCGRRRVTWPDTDHCTEPTALQDALENAEEEPEKEFPEL
jgi:hypothetical protein